MKTQTAVWIVIALAVVGAAWYYVAETVLSGTSAGSPVATTTAPTATTTQAVKTTSKAVTPRPTATTAKVAGVNTMAYLLDLKEPLVCSVKTTTGYARSGTMYVAGGKIRANFANSSMINDGTHLFAWMTGAIKGIELLSSSSVSGSAIATNGGIDPTTDISFACNPWAVDASVFTPPASVSFFSSL